MNIGFLASHNGSNMQAVVDACKMAALDGVPAVVVSNNARSKVLERAKTEGIPVYHLSSVTHPDVQALDRAIADVMKKHAVDVILLAGYTKRLGPETIAEFEGRILNIHPALLPKFAGKGMYGMSVHDAVIASGDTESGVTVHVVDTEYDSGPIVAESRVSVKPTDTPQALAERVLAREHEFVPQVLQRIATGEIELRKPLEP